MQINLRVGEKKKKKKNGLIMNSVDRVNVDHLLK